MRTDGEALRRSTSHSAGCRRHDVTGSRSMSAPPDGTATSRWFGIQRGGTRTGSRMRTAARSTTIPGLRAARAQISAPAAPDFRQSGAVSARQPYQAGAAHLVATDIVSLAPGPSCNRSRCAICAPRSPRSLASVTGRTLEPTLAEFHEREQRLVNGSGHAQLDAASNDIPVQRVDFRAPGTPLLNLRERGWLTA